MRGSRSKLAHPENKHKILIAQKQTSLRRAKPQYERCAKVFHRSLADSSAGSGIRARWQDIFLEADIFIQG